MLKLILRSAAALVSHASLWRSLILIAVVKQVSSVVVLSEHIHLSIVLFDFFDLLPTLKLLLGHHI